MDEGDSVSLWKAADMQTLIDSGASVIGSSPVMASIPAMNFWIALGSTNQIG